MNNLCKKGGNKLDYIDVYELSELPELNGNYRYMDFLGGTKQFRCYVVQKELPRCLFMENHRKELDEILQPIYMDEDICISQDASYALPGFYIVSFRKHYTNINDLDMQMFMKLSCWTKEIRNAMKNALNLEYVNIYYEEKTSKSANVHYWLMPVETINGEVPKLHFFPIKTYLENFSLKDNYEKIKKYNNIMRKYIEDKNIREKIEKVLRRDISEKQS